MKTAAATDNNKSLHVNHLRGKNVNCWAETCVRIWTKEGEIFRGEINQARASQSYLNFNETFSLFNAFFISAFAIAQECSGA
jgi:hypothetical protein